MNFTTVLNTKKQNKTILTLTHIAGILGAIIIIQGIIMYSTVSNYNSKIYPNIWIEDINVGEKTKKEAEQAIIQKNKNIISQKIITIKVNDKQYTIDPVKLDMKYDYSDIIDKAFHVSRDYNVFKRFFLIKFPNKKNFKLNNTYNYKIIESTITKIEQENNQKPVNAIIFKSGSDKFVIKKESYGKEIDSKALNQDIKNKLDNLQQEKDLLVQAKFKKTEPKIKESDLKSINTKISSFTTNFKSSNLNRSTNISVAGNAINGTVLMPNDTFSFNDVVGERSSKKGYKMAKVISNGKFVNDLGGGICQVSTTLYNAVVKANIPSVERHRHSIPSSYISLGMDATVAYGLLDYKFKNTLPYPILLESVIYNKNITFNIYSNSNINTKKI